MASARVRHARRLDRARRRGARPARCARSARRRSARTSAPARAACSPRRSRRRAASRCRPSTRSARGCCTSSRSRPMWRRASRCSTSAPRPSCSTAPRRASCSTAASTPGTPLAAALASAIASAADVTFRDVVREPIARRDEVTRWIAQAGGVAEAIADLSRALGVDPRDDLARIDAEMVDGPLLPSLDWAAVAAICDGRLEQRLQAGQAAARRGGGERPGPHRRLSVDFPHPGFRAAQDHGHRPASPRSAPTSRTGWRASRRASPRCSSGAMPW